MPYYIHTKRGTMVYSIEIDYRDGTTAFKHAKKRKATRLATIDRQINEIIDSVYWTEEQAGKSVQRITITPVS